jgi:hypothetical protein
MKIEDQVCSLEFAEKLKSLGVKQDGFFWYDLTDKMLTARTDIKAWHAKDPEKLKGYVSAFTFPELLIKLPLGTRLMVFSEEYRLCIDSIYEKFEDVPPFDCDICSTANIANLAARMLIYMIENGILKAEDL